MSGISLRHVSTAMLFGLLIQLLANMPICSAAANKENPRILILGAGMSGVAAANALNDARYTNILVLEGSSRIGGRVKEEPFGGHTIEMGSLWIRGKGSNPIYKMVVENYMSYVGEDSVDEDKYWIVRNTSGNDVSDSAEKIDGILVDVLETLDNISKEAMDMHLPDYILRSALRNQKWIPSTKLENIVEKFNIDFDDGIDPSRLSGKYLRFKNFLEMFGDEEWLIASDKRGFSTVVEEMGKRFNAETKISFDSKVKTIEQLESMVKVHTENGSFFEADYVIVTFSLGVLQQREVVFTPGLPQWKTMAFDKFGFASIAQIYIQFPTPFWDNYMYIVYASEEERGYNLWFNMNFVYPGSNMLLLTVHDEEAVRLEKMTSDDVSRELVSTLSKVYPNATLPNPLGVKVSKWSSDPLFRGAHSYWPPAFTAEDMVDMAAPIGRISFAGEHLDSHVKNGYVHSAYISGMKSANQLIKCLKSTTSCPTAHDRKPKVRGCMYSAADNYDKTATIDDGSCQFNTVNNGYRINKRFSQILAFVAISVAKYFYG